MGDTEKRYGVIEKLTEQCERAFLSARPIIAIDTYEIEMTEAVIERFSCVELVSKDIKAEYKHGVTKYIKSENGEEKENLIRGSKEIARYIKSKEPHKLAFIGTEKIVDKDGKGKIDEDILKDLRAFIESYAECADKMNYIRKSVVFVCGDVGSLPDDIKAYTTVLDVDYPEMWERCDIVRGKYAQHDLEETLKRDDPTFVCDDGEVEASIREIAYELAGFSLVQCEDMVDWLIDLGKNSDGNFVIFSRKDRKKAIFEKKEQVLKSLGDMMKLYKPNYDEKRDKKHDEDVKGFKNYYDWIEKNEKQIISDEDYALTRGIGCLKGVLLCGIPGCGKSEAALILRERWNINMLKLDVGSLMGGVVGKSESNLRRALKCAESMAPVILYIDELEKGFSGANSSRDDGSGSVFKRMFAYLLNWMQEYTKDVFIFATANDMSSLPPEFFRSGRFDALFCVHMPTADECTEIFIEQMKRAEKLKGDTAKEYGVIVKKLFNFEISEKTQSDKEKEDHLRTALATVVEEAGAHGKFLTGADIKKIIQSTLRNADKKIFEKGYDADEWVRALLETVGNTNLQTYGASSANRDKIAASYVRLMREKLLPVSDAPLFNYNFYDIIYDDEKVKGVYEEEGKTFKSEYDEKLYEDIVKRIKFFAGKIEENEAEKQTR